MNVPEANQPIDLSVVIPTFNRRDALAVLLAALERQSLPLDRFEVIVVLDGCTDDSAHFLDRWAEAHPDSRLRHITQDNAGQSAARSRGAAAATSPVLLFLDDDIVPEPSCLEAHARCHQQAPGPCVVLGDAWMTKAQHESYYAMLTRMWWEDLYVERAQRYPYYTYRDFCSGHVSMTRDLFHDIGGFDRAFQGYGGEDYDLGYRVLKAGVAFHLEPQAQATHDHHGNARRVFRNLIDEGRNDVRLGTKHPELRRGLRCASPTPLTRLLFAMPLLFSVAVGCLSVVLRVFEKLRLWHAWRWLFGKLRYVAYWLGVTKALPGWAAYRQWIDDCPRRPRTVLDITEGLPTDLSRVWLHGPSTIVLESSGRTIGQLNMSSIPHGHLAEYLAQRIATTLPDAVPLPAARTL